jgi:nitrogen regulatory protein PII
MAMLKQQEEEQRGASAYRSTELFEKVNKFIAVLGDENVDQTIEWLVNNVGALDNGKVFPRCLQELFKIAQPFGCSDLSELQSALERLYIPVMPARV